MSDSLSLSAQENILTLLVFSETAAAVIASKVPLQFYDNKVYRQIAEKAMAYLDRYKKPAKVHIADLLDRELKDDKGGLLETTLRDIYYLNNEGVNEDYVLSTLKQFLRQQKIKGGLIKSAQLVQDGKLDEAELSMLQAIRERDELTERPLSLSYSDVMGAIVGTDDEFIPLGIPELDAIGACPVRKGLLTFMGLTNRGKSWFLTQAGKAAILRRYKVLHVTLEMSAKKTLLRYTQAMFSMVQKQEGEKKKGVDVPFTVLETASDGSIRALNREVVERPSIKSKAGQLFLKHKLSNQKLERRFRIQISEFPTGMLSVQQLEAHLDTLERQSNFIPDLILIDYADLMEVDSNNLRIDIGNIYKKLRGIAVSRNAAVVTVSQTNKSVEDAKQTKIKDASEDFSKIMTSDIVLTYSQTTHERELGLARIGVGKNRDSLVGQTILISQAYHIGQFCLNSCLLKQPGSYFDQLVPASESVPEQAKPTSRGRKK